MRHLALLAVLVATAPASAAPDTNYAKLRAGAGLRDVQLALAASTKYAHPYYGASFIAQGDGSPLR